jgi:TolB protein
VIKNVFHLAYLICMMPFVVAKAQESDCSSVTSLTSDIGTIAFISNRENNQQIYLMDTERQNQRQLTDLEAAVLSDLDWSPNGKRLAYVNNSDIYVIDVEQNWTNQLTTNDGEDYNPAWSPDGKHIAYVSDRGGPYDIWVMKANGSNVGQMTADPRWEMTVEWIPDGTGLAYVPNSGADWQIWLTAWNDAFAWDTPFLIDRPTDGVLYSVTDLTWSPNSEYLALQTSYGAYMVHVDGTGLQQIEDRETYSYGGAPSWSPDSCQIVYASTQDGDAEIYVLNLEDEILRKLTDNTYNDFGPAWQPQQE